QIGCIGSDDLCLRIMDMRIDEAGENQVRAMVGDFYVAACLATYFSIISKTQDAAILNQNGAVFDIAVCGVVIEALRLVTKGQHAAADQKLGHQIGPYFWPCVAD